ncbi:MAG: cation transporter [Oscillospiraceae bacterium]
MVIGIYLILAFAVVMLSIKLAFYVDLLDKKTDISGAFIGGVILAAVTSLPELFTSLSATVFLDEPNLVIGNILGSNIFNLAAMSAICIFVSKAFKNSKIGLSHKTTIICTSFVYLLLTLSYILKFDPHIMTVSIFSIAIAVVYFISLKTMSNDDGLPDIDVPLNSDLTIPQITRRFILCSVLLIIVSIGVTYTTDIIAEKFSIGATFAGALLLGVATSLPELSSSIKLAKMGNFNALVGNILGSNMFNFLILTVADMTYIKSGIYNYSGETVPLLLLGFAAHLAMMIIIFTKTSVKPQKEKSIWIYIIPNIAVIAFYITFVVMCATK